MSAAKKALDALEASINATFPKPGAWRWEANQASGSVSLGTRGNEAMTFARWGMQGAQPVFMTRSDVSILRDASEFLQPIPGREHHKWAKRIEHPVAQTIEHSVNLSAPLAAVARAAMAWRSAMRMTDEANGAELGGADVDAVSAMDREDAAKDQLDAALDALEAAAKEVTT